MPSKKILTNEVMWFFRHQYLTIVSSIDKNGVPHNSCKGIVEINPNGWVYLLDLYRGKTLENLKRNSNISITAVDEHKFAGYTLKGNAKIIKKLTPQLIKVWDKRIASRITQRLLKEIHGEKGHARQPEAILPKPEYIIAVKVKNVVDLTPGHLK